VSTAHIQLCERIIWTAIIGFLPIAVSAASTRPFAPISDLTVGQKADWCIDHYFPRIIDWIKGWVAAANAKPGLDILFTHFEQMKSDEPSFFKTLLGHAGHEYGSFGDSKMNEDTMRSSANYHLGETDEWRRILNNAQIEKLNQLIPDDLAKRFNWIKT